MGRSAIDSSSVRRKSVCRTQRTEPCSSQNRRIWLCFFVYCMARELDNAICESWSHITAKQTDKQAVIERFRQYKMHFDVWHVPADGFCFTSRCKRRLQCRVLSFRWHFIARYHTLIRHSVWHLLAPQSMSVFLFFSFISYSVAFVAFSVSKTISHQRKIACVCVYAWRWCTVWHNRNSVSLPDVALIAAIKLMICDHWSSERIAALVCA